MKNLLLILTLLILAHSNSEAARFATDQGTISVQADNRYVADSLIHKKQADVNPAATASLVISSLSIFAMIFTINLLSVGLFFLTGALAITGLVFGIIGIRNRRTLLKSKYASVRNRRKLPLGQGRSVIGVVIGSIMTFAFGVLLVELLAFGF